MKLFKKILLSSFIIICSLTVLQVSLLDLPVSSMVEASSIKINKTKYTLSKGSTYKLKIKGTSKKINKWRTKIRTKLFLFSSSLFYWYFDDMI